MEKLARTLSWLFIPLMAPVIALMIAVYVPADSVMDRNEILFLIPADWKNLLLIMFAFFSILVPSFTILFMRFSGTISTVMMDNRKERIIPSFFVNLSAAALYYMVEMKDPDHLLPSAVYGLMIGSFTTVFICTIITRWWKISLHAAGMGILSGFLFAYYWHIDYYFFWILPVSLLLSGIVMSARMYLGKHSLEQCLAGYAVGIVALVISIIKLHP